MDSPTPTCRRPTAPVHQTRIRAVLTLIDIVELTGAESKCSIKLGDGFKADHANRGTRPESSRCESSRSEYTHLQHQGKCSAGDRRQRLYGDHMGKPSPTGPDMTTRPWVSVYSVANKIPSRLDSIKRY